jgi:hypothetical protein
MIFRKKKVTGRESFSFGVMLQRGIDRGDDIYSEKKINWREVFAKQDFFI